MSSRNRHNTTEAQGQYHDTHPTPVMSTEQGKHNQHTLYNIANDQLHQDGHQVERDNCTLYPDTQREETLN